ncbi:glycogen/starch synthase [Chromatiaceae bacterium AAb-1]|nr:glycogen/starch synthase [Chromatiaceae bacterium AAb-1]
MRILFLCSEYEGLIKTGGLADACRGLATALVAAGHQVTVMLPRYAPLYELATTGQQSVYFPLGGRSLGCAVRYMQLDGVDIALVEHHDFFHRQRPYDDGHYGYDDNPLRFAFFCKAALEWCVQTGQQFDIIHGHDWQTAAAAYYLQQYRYHAALAAVPFIFSVHNGAYQQQCDISWAAQLDISVLPGTPELNFLALGVQYATKVNTVSNGYRDELLSEPAANGLAVLYQQRKSDFSGILNGCDYQQWAPSIDPLLPARYDKDDLAGKAQCKKILREQYQLADTAQPLFVAVSRLTGQKGYDYLIPALWQWLPGVDAQVLIVGSGEAKYVHALSELATAFPRQVRFVEGFNEPLAHQVEAAGDFFLMPSLFEPCGLNQLYSLRYGTVPVVRLTGGLRDTVIPWPDNLATGIGFSEPSVIAMQQALQQALDLYQQPELYRQLQYRGMQQNFSWQQAAEQYLQLYRQAGG